MGLYAVTGAASGIGKAVAQQLREAGHEVITVDLRDADICADLSDESQCAEVVRKVREKAADGLDGFVPCAGLGPDVPKKSLVPLVNYFGTVSLVEGLRQQLQQKRGTIVLISSNSAQLTEYDAHYMDTLLAGDRAAAVQLAESLDGQVLYGGGKQALARWMRRENAGFAAEGIRMNAIAPGYTETGMTAAGEESPEYGDAIRAFKASIPIGRAGSPEDQANAVLFLLSDKASFISGSVLFVDGGHDATFRPDRF
jgi:NAD(P)-dependent dehydrogenase (short-subunit alcohol dehydrogenase family)